MMTTGTSQAAFTNAYIEAALWSSTDDNDVPLDRNYDASDIDGPTLAAMRADCERFYAEHVDDIHCEGAPTSQEDGTLSEREAVMAGHDFWLTRNNHGAGFWDGDWPEPHATALDNAARAFGEVDFHAWDGVIYT